MLTLVEMQSRRIVLPFSIPDRMERDERGGIRKRSRRDGFPAVDLSLCGPGFHRGCRFVSDLVNNRQDGCYEVMVGNQDRRGIGPEVRA